MRTEADLPDSVRDLIVGGRSAAERQDYDEATRLLKSALQISRQIRSAFGECAAARFLGNVAFNLCEDVESRRLHKAALEIARQENDDLGIATSLGSIAMIDVVEGDFAAAEANYRAATEAYERVGLPDRAKMMRDSIEHFVIGRVPIETSSTACCGSRPVVEPPALTTEDSYVTPRAGESI